MGEPARNLALEEVPALDGLRAVAVLLVMLLHFDWLGCGWIGVQFFFVLSGFLISANLFVAQDKLSRRDLITSFYIKRFLRIFPLYYLSLGIYFLFETSPLFLKVFSAAVASGPQGYLAHGLFLQNFSTALFHSQGTIRGLAHFWSLAVEEQFYLVFPFLLAFLNRGKLRALAWAVVLGAPFVRAWIADASAYKNTLGQADAFAIGILLSMGWTKNPDFRRRCMELRGRIIGLTAAYSALLLAFGLFLLTLYRARGISIGNTTLGFETSTAFSSHIWVFTLMDVLGGLLVLVCLLESRNRILANPFLRYIGRISFGLYVYHYPIAFALEENLHFKFKSAKGAVLFVAYFAASVGIATISYFLWEKPFLQLKKKLSSSFLRPRTLPSEA